jgi:hypothetical protein
MCDEGLWGNGGKNMERGKVFKLGIEKIWGERVVKC